MTDEQFSALMGVLTEIRDAVLLPMLQEPESTTCQHPDDHRVSLATFGDPDHWICQDCRYEHSPLSRN